MSTRATWAHVLAGRCRKVGWDVEQIDGGVYKVRCPDRYVVQLHLTSSDVNASRTAERALNAHGLAEAEAKADKKKAVQKKAKLAADAAAAAQATKRTVQRAAADKALARAAGPYLTLEEVDTDWFTTAHPAPWVRWCMISPEQAQHLLDKTNRHNRRLRPDIADRYARIILTGQWRTTHQGLAFDTNGVLQDGQHRLAAIVSANVPVPVMVFVGMDPDNFKTIDEGMLRKADQLLGMANQALGTQGEQNTVTLSACIRLANAYVSPNPRYVSAKQKPSNADIFNAFMAEPDELREATMWARRHYNAVACSPGVLAAARYLLRRVNGTDNPFVAAFLDGVATGAKAGTRTLLDDDDPRRKLRAYFHNRRELKKRADQLSQLAVIIKAWNYVLDDNRRIFLKITKDSAIPLVKVCTPHGDNASAPPPLLADEVHP